jgi:phosphoserine aminotransferase
VTEPATVIIPDELKPSDGRFGSGPSLVRPEQVLALVEGPRAGLLGTSHRAAPVRSLVGALREGVAELFGLPPGYEVLLGDGGATAVWDALTFGLIEQRSQHAVSGEFGAKFAQAATAAPQLGQPTVIEVQPGRRALCQAEADVDVYAWTHNETSTGVMTPVLRPAGAAEGQLVVVDGTSGAGGLLMDAAQTDFYYFSPQKNFGADAGVWFAFASPAGVERIERIAAGGRWMPSFLSLSKALANSRKNQTLNTPGIAALILMEAQVNWLLEHGGLAWAHARTCQSSRVLYEWAEACPVAEPFVQEAVARSQVVVTIDFAESVDAARLVATLRANGIVDVDPYRSLGRNQLRVATFVSREPADVVKLTQCLDYLLDAWGVV